MKKSVIYLDGNKKQIIELIWKKDWSNTKVIINGKEIGEIKSRIKLEEGRHFNIGNGNTLSISLKKGLIPEIKALINGVPEPVSHKLNQNIRRACLVLLAWSISYIVGALFLYFDIELLYLKEKSFIGLSTLGPLILLIALGIWSKSQFVAIITMFYLGIYSLKIGKEILDFLASSTKNDLAIIIPVIKLAFLISVFYLVYQSFEAMKAFKKREAEFKDRIQN